MVPLNGNVPSASHLSQTFACDTLLLILLTRTMIVHLDSGHSSAAVALLISNNENPQNFDDFSSSLAKDWFQVSLSQRTSKPTLAWTDHRPAVIDTDA